MSRRPSTNPDRFGPHSAGVLEFFDAAEQLNTDQWLEVAAVRRRGYAKENAAEYHRIFELQDHAPLTQRSAVGKLADRTFQDAKGPVRDMDRASALALRSAISMAAYAVAFPELLEEQFDLAVAPFVAVGIDCHGLARMGR